MKDNSFSEFGPLVERLKSTRKVVTSSIRHGIACEPLAANAYVDVNKFLNLKINIVEMLISFGS